MQRIRASCACMVICLAGAEFANKPEYARAGRFRCLMGNARKGEA
jgi:hypothetical protein